MITVNRRQEHGKNKADAERSTGGKAISLNMLGIRTARKVAAGAQRFLDVVNQERGYAGRTDKTSLHFVRATGKFVAMFEKTVNNTREFTIKVQDFRNLYRIHVADFVKSEWWDTLSLEAACRMGVHRYATYQTSHEDVSEEDWNIGSIWCSVGAKEDDNGSYLARIVPRR